MCICSWVFCVCVCFEVLLIVYEQESSGVAAETRRAILRYCFVVACRLRSRRRRFRFLFSLFMLFQPLRISPTEVKQKRYSMML